MRKTVAPLVLLAALAGALPGAAAVSGPIQVLGGPEDQFLPAANDDYLIWTQNSTEHPARYHAYGRRLGTTNRFRLNPPGTRGFSGGIDPDQDRAIYQQVGGGSDLYFFDLDDRTRNKISGPVNSSKWERDPRVSNAFIFFARDAAGTTALLLFDRAAGTLQRIGRWDLTRYFVAPGAVDERFATWTVCGPLTCNAFLYDSQVDARTRIPGPAGRAQYAPVVSEPDGFVFFVRSGQACGSQVTVRRVPLADLDGPSEVVLALPAGIDAEWMMSSHRADSGRLDLWFARHRCASRQGDLYKLRDVAAA